MDRVNVPADLPALGIDELEQLASDIRALIINTVSKTGGHLAANLGAVELTIALLRVFQPPRDKIVWDVSHQTYTYKILTGRKERFHTIRQLDGLSGFLRRSESEYDAFGAGHSGTALSAALGMAVARDRTKGAEHVVGVLGDASLGCGVSLEACNNIATTTRRFVVVLNDNEMSISANVGALSRYLGGLLASPRYNRWKRALENMAQRLHMGWLRSSYYRLEEATKSLFLRSVIFEEFGVRYIGPVDGHNVRALLDAFTIARDSDRPIIVHVSTQKGRGYSFAEALPEKWHGTAGFDVKSGEPLATSASRSYSTVFGSVMLKLAAADERIMAITAAMPSGTGLAAFAKRFPDRFFDVGISEEHALVFAAGLAASGLRPVFAVYSTFAQRAVDMLIHDVCLQGLPVTLCLDRAGVVGDDGPTHHGVFDIALMRSIPGLTIMQPGNEAELANMLFTASRLDAPVVIRYPRGAGPGVVLPDAFADVAIGRAEVLREGCEIQIWALGDMIPLARSVADELATEGLRVGVVNARFVRPLDTDLLAEHARGARVIATAENGVVTGGFGAAVAEALAQLGFGGRIVRVGWPDEFVEHGPVEILMERCGLTAEALAGELRRHAKGAS